MLIDLDKKELEKLAKMENKSYMVLKNLTKQIEFSKQVVLYRFADLENQH